MDGDADPVGMVHESGVDDLDALHRRRHLRGTRRVAPETTDGAEGADLGRAHVGEQARSEQRAESAEAGQLERGQADPVDCVEALDEIGQRLDRLVGLGIDVEASFGKGFEQIGHQRNRMAFATRVHHTCFGDLGRRHLDDVRVDPARAVQVGIVE